MCRTVAGTLLLSFAFAAAACGSPDAAPTGGAAGAAAGGSAGIGAAGAGGAAGASDGPGGSAGTAGISGTAGMSGAAGSAGQAGTDAGAAGAAGGVSCTPLPDCDDGDPQTVDLVVGDGCAREPATGPSDPARTGAAFLCEQQVQASCGTLPAVELAQFGCTTEAAPYQLWDAGYPLQLLWFASDVPTGHVRVLLTLRVGVLEDRFAVSRVEGATVTPFGTYTAAALDQDQLTIDALPSGDGYVASLFLRPVGNPAAGAIQFSVEGVVDDATGTAYTVGCDGAAWSSYGAFARIPAHGVLTIDASVGDAACVGDPARSDAATITSGGFYRTTCDPRVWQVADDLASRHLFAGTANAFRAWLNAQPQYDAALFCGRDLVVVPDGTLASIPVTAPLGL